MQAHRSDPLSTIDGLLMSPAQRENLVTGHITRMEDSERLGNWLPDAVHDLSRVEVGIFRCPTGGEPACPEGECCDCTCCDQAELWEAPLNATYAPECRCGRQAFLVEVVGVRDYRWQVS